MSGLTDIIFLLLIFFLLTSTMVNLNAVDILLPSASNKTTTKPTASISINAEGNYFFDKEPISLDEVKGRLEAALATDAETIVVLNAEKNTGIQDVVNVFGIAKDLDIQIILATEPVKKWPT